MKIQTPNLQLNTKQNGTKNVQTKSADLSFGGTFDVANQFLNFLDTNKALGANLVDLSFMVTPRTLVDFTRGPDAGFETMRRESGGLINHSLVGVYGAVAAYLFAQGLNSKYTIKNAQKLFASDETVDILGQMWHQQIHNSKIQTLTEKNAKEFEKTLGRPLSKEEKILGGFLTRVFKNLEGFNPIENGGKGWSRIKDENVIKNAVKALFDELSPQEGKVVGDKVSKETQKYIKAIIGSSVGSESHFKLNKFGIIEKELTLDALIDNVYKLAKMFKSENVAKIFESVTDFGANEFVKSLKGFNKKVSIGGMAFAAIAGMSVQPFNKYLTKKKTGNEGFVGGDKDRKPDKSAGFWAMKVAAVGAFATMVLSTLGNPKTLIKNPNLLLKKIQFKGFIPTIDQFKFIYGVTISSRFLAARDKDELREAATKDTLGFLNWIVLGNFVTKLVGMGFEKAKIFGSKEENSYLKYNILEHGKGWFKKLTKSDMITRDEVLYSALKKKGIAIVKEGKQALTSKEMLHAIEEAMPGVKHTRMKLKLLSAAQLLGYFWSGLALGVGIPKLNIAATKHIGEKREAKRKALYASPANIAFLNDKTQNVQSFVNFTSVK